MRAESIKRFFGLMAQEETPAVEAGAVSTKREEHNQMLQEPVALIKSETPQTTVSKRPLHFSNGMQTVSPEMAERILAECNFPGQRAISHWLVAALAYQMKRGSFTEGMQIHFVRFNDRYLLVDGQHRMSALIKAGVELKFSFLVTEATEESEIAQAYYRHDALARKRSNVDCLRAIDVSAQQALSVTEANKVLAAVRIIENGFNHGAGGNLNLRNPEMAVFDRVLEKAKIWWTPARLFYDAIGGCQRLNSRLLQRREILAVALITLRYQAERAVTFWGSTAADDGLRAGDPRKQLLNFLNENSGYNSASVPITRAASVCWNYWLNGQSLKKIYANTDAPIVIEGTPIGRKKGK